MSVNDFKTNAIRLILSVLYLMSLGFFTPLKAESLQNDSESALTLEVAVNAAIKFDPWLSGNQHQQDSIESLSVAAGTLPDPKISLGIANIAADSFDFNQESMTQFKVSVSQMFPRGESLTLKKKQLQLIGSQYPFQREDRKAKVTVIAAKLWLDAYKAQESIALIENDRALFEQLADVAQASYSSALGKTRQQDIVRAQLELTRLDDRLTQLRQTKEISEQKLFEWLNSGINQEPIAPQVATSGIHFARRLPSIGMLNESLFTSKSEATPQFLYQYLSKHPVVAALKQKIRASESGIDLAEQNYKPEWGVSAGYGVRNDASTGMDRADLFSIGVSFDIPLFTSNRQDQQVRSAISKAAAVKTEKWLLIRKLIASFEANRTQLIRLNERQKLYQKRLLPQMHDQAEASLTAYTNDDGDFAEVVRSRIAELNASIDALSINVERQKIIVQLNYYFMKSADEIISNNGKTTSHLGENQ